VTGPPDCASTLAAGWKCNSTFADFCPGITNPVIPSTWFLGASCGAYCGNPLCKDKMQFDPVAMPFGAQATHCIGDERLDRATCTAATCTYCGASCSDPNDTCECDTKEKCTRVGGEFRVTTCTDIAYNKPAACQYAAYITSCCKDGILDC
jgi:hypothetical protein